MRINPHRLVRPTFSAYKFIKIHRVDIGWIRKPFFGFQFWLAFSPQNPRVTFCYEILVDMGDCSFFLAIPNTPDRIGHIFTLFPKKSDPSFSWVVWFSETNGCISNSYLFEHPAIVHWTAKLIRRTRSSPPFFLHPKKSNSCSSLFVPTISPWWKRSWTRVRCSWGLFFFWWH